MFSNHPAAEMPFDPQALLADGIISNDIFIDSLPVRHPATDVRVAVLMNSTRTRHPFVPKAKVFTVDLDNAAVAQAAADLFVRHGLQHFAFVGTLLPRYWSDARRNAFVAAVARHGGTVATYAPHPTKAVRWSDEMTRLSAWLTSLPKPCGVFAAVDFMALHVLTACRRAKIAVPEQVSVVGVDNEDILCELAQPALSSIAPDFERAGYRAAETIDAFLSRQHPPVRQTFGISGVIERRSTIDQSGASRIVSLAMDFIRRNATTPISVSDVASACHISQRGLQMRFETVLGRTPVAAIRDARLDRVRDMLLRTSTSISVICNLCGFQSQSYMKTEFRKKFGMTPSHCRDSHRRTKRPKGQPMSDG